MHYFCLFDSILTHCHFPVSSCMRYEITLMSIFSCLAEASLVDASLCILALLGAMVVEDRTSGQPQAKR